MATTPQVEVGLTLAARWFVIIAACLAKMGMRIPHRWVVAVTDRSWRIRFGGGRWEKLRYDSAGRVIR